MASVFKRARLAGRDGLVDITVDGGVITGIEEAGQGEVGGYDVQGRLLTGGFVEPHIHLDKALLSSRGFDNRAGTLAEAFRLNKEAKQRYTVKDVRDRARELLGMYLDNGIVALRAHVDVDIDIGLTGLQGVLEACDEVRDELLIQIVAFPHFATKRYDGSLELLKDALDMGATVLGAFPDVENHPQRGYAHLDEIFELAASRDVDIDAHIDEGESCTYLEYLAMLTKEFKYEGRVTASHACGLGSISAADKARIIERVRSADVAIVTCPMTNLLMGGRYDNSRPRRGLAPTKELIDAGVRTAWGQDNLQDMFCPFGDGDPLKIAFVGSLAAGLTGAAQITESLDLCSGKAAKVIGVPDYGIVVGNSASLILLNGENAMECVQKDARRTVLMRRGRVVAVHAAS